MDRRSFIKLTAVSGTTAALTACGSPDTPLIRFVPDEDIVPGQAVWKAGVCPVCAAGCGLTVRVMDADTEIVRDGQRGLKRILAAKKLEGAPAHPVNQGGLCARGQAAIQITYHPDRITEPLRRTGDRGDRRYEAISWDDALAELAGRLDALAGAGRQETLAYLARPGRSARALVAGEFLARFGAPPPIVYELFSDEVLRRANELSFGRAQLPTLDLPNTRYVISFGADFLGTWNSPVSQSAGYGAMRQGRRGVRGHFVQVEPRMSQTGANADEWVPARPGTEGALALGLAHVIMRDRLRPASAAGRAGARIPGWQEGLPDHAPAAVEQRTGVAAARIERLARELAETPPAMAIVGGAPVAHTNGLFTAMAVNALNALLGTVGQPGGLFFMPQLDLPAAARLPRRTAGPPPTIERFAAEILAGSPAAAQVVMIDGANPVFTAPPAWRVGEALAKVPYIVSFGGFLDDTSILADLILPDHSFLESWTATVPEAGAQTAVISAAAPVMRPLYDTRATEEVLFDLGRRLRQPIELPWRTLEELLIAIFAAFPPELEGGDTWTEVQERGGWWGTPPSGLEASVVGTVTDAPGAAAVARVAEPTFDGEASQYPFHLLPYPSTQFLDGSVAHLPWLQEMPDPLTSAMWSSWVEINPATAARLGIAQGDIVEISSSQGTLRSAAMITPGIAPDVVAMPVGQGHRSFTRYASGRGENPTALLAPLAEPVTGALAWAATRVRIARAGGPDGRLILFAGGMREHVEEPR